MEKLPESVAYYADILGLKIPRASFTILDELCQENPHLLYLSVGNTIGAILAYMDLEERLLKKNTKLPRKNCSK